MEFSVQGSRVCPYGPIAAMPKSRRETNRMRAFLHKWIEGSCSKDWNFWFQA